MLMQVVTNGPTNRSKDERETTTMAFDIPQVLPVSTFDYNGNSMVAMAGKNCVAIATDTRLST